MLSSNSCHILLPLCVMWHDAVWNASMLTPHDPCPYKDMGGNCPKEWKIALKNSKTSYFLRETSSTIRIWKVKVAFLNTSFTGYSGCLQLEIRVAGMGSLLTRAWQARLPWEFRFFAFTTFTFALPKVRIRIKKLEVHFLWKMHLFV